MIKMPQRSVTRFFIPMIDVLTLLFCMFLLLPIMRENESLSQEGPGGKELTGEELRQEIASRQKDLRDLYKDQQRARSVLGDLEKRKREFLQHRLVSRVLDISPSDGTLSFFDPKQPALPPQKLDNEAAARKLIEKHKKEAGDLELFYVFQRPQDPAVKHPRFPQDGQTEQYSMWFRDVAYGGYLTPPAAKGSGP